MRSGSITRCCCHSLAATLRAAFEGFASGELTERTLTTLGVLAQGYVLGVAGAAVLTVLAVSNRWGLELLNTLTSMFNPLPAWRCCPSHCSGLAWACRA